MVSTTDTRIDPPRSGASFELFGSTLTARVTAADTHGDYALIEYDAPPGLPGAPTHLHEHTEEYIFVLEGVLNVTVEGKQTTLGPGAGILFPRGVEHSFANQSDNPTRFVTLLRPGGFETLLATVAARLTREDWEPTPEEFAAITAPYDIVITDHAH